MKHPEQNSVSLFGPIVSYVVAIVITTLLLMFQLFNTQPFETSLKLGFALLVLLSLWRLGGICVLLAVQAYLLFTETSSSMSAWYLYVILPTLTLSLVAFVERVRALRATRRPPPRTPAANWTEWAKEIRRRCLPGNLQLAKSSRGEVAGKYLMAVASLLAVVFVSTLVAGWILRMIPLDARAPDMVRLRPTELRGIVLAAALMALMIAVFIVVGELKWRMLSPSQARVYLRGYFAHWIETEWLTISWQRGKSKRRTRKRQRLAGAEVLVGKIERTI